MKIFRYEIHRKKQLDILGNVLPLFIIHKHVKTKERNALCKRILVVYYQS